MRWLLYKGEQKMNRIKIAQYIESKTFQYYNKIVRYQKEIEKEKNKSTIIYLESQCSKYLAIIDELENILDFVGGKNK